MINLTQEQEEAFIAAAKGKLQAFHRLLEKDPGFALVRRQGWRTPLYDAAGRGDLALAKRLISLGCPLEPAEDGKLAPLHCTALSGQRAMAEVLLNHSANVDRRDQNGMTALHHLVYRCAWHRNLGVTEEDFAFIELLLRTGANPNLQPPMRSVGYDGTCLEMALLRGNYRLADLLLVHGARGDLYKRDTPTLAALLYRHPKLRQGAAPPSTFSSLVQDAFAYPEGHPPIHQTIVDGALDSLQARLQTGWDVASRNPSGRTPLHLAALLGERAVVQLLLEYGADSLTSSYEGEMASELAGQTGREDIVSFIDHSKTLMTAAANDAAEIIENALQKKPELVNWATAEHGCTLLHTACHSGALMVARLLLQRGADPNQTDQQGLAALHFVWDNIELARLLVEGGANVNLADNNGRTPVRSSQGDARRFLLSQGASIICLRKMWAEMLSHAVSQTGHLNVWQEKDGSLELQFSAVQLLLRTGRVLKIGLENLREKPARDFPNSTHLRLGALRLSLEPSVSICLEGYGRYTADKLVLEDGSGEFSLEAMETRHLGWVEAWQAGELGDDIAGNLSIPLK